MKHTALISFAITFLAGLAAIIMFPYYTVNPGVLIEDHLNHCVINQIKKGEENKSREELLKLFGYK